MNLKFSTKIKEILILVKIKAYTLYTWGSLTFFFQIKPKIIF